MKYPVDLHLHSNLSDGDYSPERVFKIAKEKKLKAVSLTDHDTWVYFDRKNYLAQKEGIVHIAGLEISCGLKTDKNTIEVHVLGYAKKFKIAVLQKGLKKTIDGYNQRIILMIDKLKKNNIINLDFNRLKKKKNKNLAVRRYDLAKALMARFHKSRKQISIYIERGGVAFVPYGKWAMAPSQAVKLIHQAGGIAVLAHPGETYNKLQKEFNLSESKKKFNNLTGKLIKSGLDGIEVYSRKNDLAMTKLCLKLAQRHKLVITGGSDWHGRKHHPEIMMGDGGLTKLQYKLFQQVLNKKTE